LGQAVSADAETILRLAWAGAQLDRKTAIQFLSSAASAKEKEAKKRMSEAQAYRPSEEDPDSLYRGMRMRVQAEQLNAEGRSLFEAREVLHEWIERRKTQNEQQQAPSNKE
jgi:hypothetical protein